MSSSTRRERQQERDNEYSNNTQQQQQQQNQELTVLDQVIDKLKSGNNNKINSYDLLSGFVAYLQEVEDQIKIIRCIFISLLPLSHYLFEE